VVNPKNETKSLVGVYVKVRRFSGLLGLRKHEFIAFGQETIFDVIGNGSAVYKKTLPIVSRHRPSAQVALQQSLILLADGNHC
ncbi:MAG: hypothetical protein L0220_13865, partial [Acidobacteria bacterium]|nr:hypothetical protein [Acidobacteriota bacterium]